MEDKRESTTASDDVQNLRTFHKLREQNPKLYEYAKAALTLERKEVLAALEKTTPGEERDDLFR